MSREKFPIADEFIFSIMNTEDWSVKEIIQKRLTFYTEKRALTQGKSVKRGGGKALIPAALRKSDKGESGKNQKI